MSGELKSAIERARRYASGRNLCFLDSARSGESSHVLYDPEAVYCFKDGLGVLQWRDGREETSGADPFRFVGEQLQERPEWTAAGYWGYDLRYAVERLPRLALDDLRLPDCRVGFYAAAQPVPVDAGEVPPTFQSTGRALPGIHDTETRESYRAKVRRVLEYIAAGDCYQVNLSHRMSLAYSGSAWGLYERLRERAPAPYAAFLDGGDHQVLSSSPELFLRVRGKEVETRPIKGTRPRGRTPEEDAALAAELCSSVKDRAELLIIVDLLRNDLGRVCEMGSVHVPVLRSLETYSNVHHLVATVRGRLRPEVDALECLRAAFPGGSITGAPKIRAMEIIEELEPVRRGVYTGAIGWADGKGNAEWNIAIRTLVLKDGQAHLHVGGGIVADSDPDAEYDETLTKARGMLAALGGAS